MEHLRQLRQAFTLGYLQDDGGIVEGNYRINSQAYAAVGAEESSLYSAVRVPLFGLTNVSGLVPFDLYSAVELLKRGTVG